MTRNNELKGIGIKTRTYCYFDDMMNVNVFNLKNIIVDWKSYKDVVTLYIENETSDGVK